MAKVYTVEEARAALPSVIAVVERVREAYLALRKLQASISVQQRGAAGDGHFVDTNPWAEENDDDGSDLLSETLQGGVLELSELGVEVKDIERGLIDFRSRRDGEIVYLCYMLGEPELAYWHRIPDGFAGRHPL